ncbi:hypothetical protein APASM_5442 [Actinosynnema pretiosum subsp. pretiosum]|nr:hypothetical protein APASM_5442 [Actinosynnema pretiosum subsp. pretiosum]
MWPFRKRTPAPTGPDGAAGPAQAGPVLRGEWRGLPPIQRALPEHPLVNPVSSFTGGLTSWRSPAFLAPLGHFVAESEPSGVIGEPPREGVVFSRPGGIPAGTGSGAVGSSAGSAAVGAGRSSAESPAVEAVGPGGAGGGGVAGAGGGAGLAVSRAVETSPATEGLAGDGFTGGGFAESAAATGGTAARAATAVSGTVAQRSVTPEPLSVTPEPVSAGPEPVVRTLGVDRSVPVDVETSTSPHVPDVVEPVAQALPLAPRPSNATPEPAVQRGTEAPAAPVSRQFIAPPRAVRSGLGEPLAQRPAETPVMPGFPEAGSAPSEESVSGQPSNEAPVNDIPTGVEVIGSEVIGSEVTGGEVTSSEVTSAGLVGSEPLSGGVVQRAVEPDAVAPAPATVSRSVELPVVPAAGSPVATTGKGGARALGLGQPRTIQTDTTTPPAPSSTPQLSTPQLSTPQLSVPLTGALPLAPSIQRLEEARPTEPVVRRLGEPQVVRRAAGGDRPVSLSEMVQRSMATDLPADLSADLPAELPVVPAPSASNAPSAQVQRFEQVPVLSLAPGLPQRFAQRQAESAAPTTSATWSAQRELAAPSTPAPGPRTPASVTGLTSALGGGTGSVGPSGWSLDPQLAQTLGISLGDDPQPGLAVQGYTAPRQAPQVQQGFSWRPGIAAPPTSPALQALPLQPAFPAPPPGPAAQPHFAVQREVHDPPPGDSPVPPQDPAYDPPSGPPPGPPDASPATPATPASTSTTTTSPTAPTAPAAQAIEPEELLKKLYDPLLRRLKAELWLDRERRGSLTDRLH